MGCDLQFHAIKCCFGVRHFIFNQKLVTFTKKKKAEPQNLKSKMESHSQSTGIQQQKEPALKHVISSLTKITLSFAGIEK